MRFHCVALLAFSFAAAAAGQTEASWNYVGKTGPLNWGKLDPAFRACSQGHEQSPIDIRHARLNKSLQPIEFHYLSGPVEFENTGKTVIARVRPGSYIIANGVRYELTQFHFHHPGEEAVKGKLVDMVAHLVHKSADGKIAVIAIRFSVERGDPNALLAALWPYLPAKVGDKQQITDMINPGGFLPADRGYWTYTGSLTAPPCTEGVQWFVFQEVLSMSRSQLRALTSVLPMNARPLQDTHGRRIEASE